MLLAVLALRLPFLNQAIQGDDVNYLYGAQHAQIDPLHPNHARYVYLGRLVDMRGQPHPPLNSWYLAALLAILGDVKEVPYHAAYILFSVIAAVSALSLARRFSPHPLAAALLFIVTPAFVVNGNSLESDLPFVAFWLLSIALFVKATDTHSIPLLLAASAAMSLGAMSAYQAVIMTPILLLYGRKWPASWLAALTAPAVVSAWQLYERFSSGALPVAVLAGYMQSYNLQAVEQKLKSAAALTGHLGWLVFPGLWIPGLGAIPFAIGGAFLDLNPLFWASFAIGAGIIIWCARNWRDFLAQWILIFFASALVIFFAGAARYLLPIALPVAILATRRLSLRWLYAGFACELALSVLLAVVNYQHWDGYRQFARALRKDSENKRVWVNGEWGLRFYLEQDGALPLMQGQVLHPGEIVVFSELAFPMRVSTGGGVLETMAQRDISSPIPLRLVALHGRSAYSSPIWGLRPLDVSTNIIDRVRAELAIERKPVLSVLPMNAPEAEQQIVSGIYGIENGQWRWMGAKGVVLLKPPGGPAKLTIRLFIPDPAPGRSVEAFVNGRRVASQTYAKPGAYTLESAPLDVSGESIDVTITIDKTFSTPGDQRQLGLILTAIALR